MKVKLLIYYSIYIPILIYSHEFWVAAERIRSSFKGCFRDRMSSYQSKTYAPLHWKEPVLVVWTFEHFGNVQKLEKVAREREKTGHLCLDCCLYNPDIYTWQKMDGWKFIHKPASNILGHQPLWHNACSERLLVVLAVVILNKFLLFFPHSVACKMDKIANKLPGYHVRWHSNKQY